jgi:hypothetical protein
LENGELLFACEGIDGLPDISEVQDVIERQGIDLSSLSVCFQRGFLVYHGDHQVV